MRFKWCALHFKQSVSQRVNRLTAFSIYLSIKMTVNFIWKMASLFINCSWKNNLYSCNGYVCPSVERKCMSIYYCLLLSLTRVLCLDHSTDRDSLGGGQSWHQALLTAGREGQRSRRAECWERIHPDSLRLRGHPKVRQTATELDTWLQVKYCRYYSFHTYFSANNSGMFLFKNVLNVKMSWLEYETLTPTQGV